MPRRRAPSKDPNVNWHRDDIQFARLIAELEAAGAFTREVMHELCVSMDLEVRNVRELVDRAQAHWDWIKEKTR